MPTWIEADGPNVPVGSLCKISSGNQDEAYLAEVVRVDASGIAMVPLSQVSGFAVGDRVEALAGDGALLTPQIRQRLALLEQLCPGDFAAVKRQAAILDTQLGALEFLEQLEAEHRIKPEVRENRGIGFLQ